MNTASTIAPPVDRTRTHPAAGPSVTSLPQASWMPWIGPNRPVSPSEESVFVRDLAALVVERDAEFRRSDVTAVLNALRCGLTVDSLLEQAPGLQPDRLFAAYLELDRLRFASEFAWTAIALSGTLETFHEHREEAAKLLPALIARLDEAERTDPENFDAVLLELAGAVSATGVAVERIEHVLCDASPDRAVDLGRVVYNPDGSGLTSRADYLPSRVGTLVPTRVASLLGESVEHLDSVRMR